MEPFGILRRGEVEAVVVVAPLAVQGTRVYGCRVDGAFVFHARLKEVSATGGASQGRCLPGLRVSRKSYRGPGTHKKGHEWILVSKSLTLHLTPFDDFPSEKTWYIRVP